MPSRYLLYTARGLHRVPYFKGRDRVVAGLLRIGGQMRLDINGFTYILDPRDNVARSIALRGSLPTEISGILAELAEPGMTVVDVGASIGFTTMAMARAVGPHGRVIAFEPAALAYDQLRRNLAENGFDWAHAERSACGDVAGTAQLNVATVSTEYSSLAPCISNLDSRSETVTVVRLDEQLKRPVHIVKVDVEGSEWGVLRGLGSLLSTRPILVLETIPALTKRFGYHPDEMLDWLRGFGYRIESLASQDVICR